MILRKVSLVVSVIFLYSCAGDLSDDQINSVKSQASSNNNKVCLQYLSAANVNRTNSLYQECVDAYNIAINEGCGDKYSQQIFQWMGRSYINLGKLDSAKWAIKKGLRIMPDDLQLLNVAAFLAKKQNLNDDRLFYLDKKLQLEEEVQGLLDLTNLYSNEEDILDLQKSLGMTGDQLDGLWNNYMNSYISSFKNSRDDTYKQLNEYYKDLEDYDEQILILDDWYDYNPNNSIIFKEKKTAYINLGRNPIDIDKDKWKKEPSNIRYGINYIKKLKEESEPEKIIDVCLALLDYDQNNIVVLENIADAYLDIYEQEKALNIYNKLIGISDDKIAYFIEVSKIYLDLGDYNKAINFSEKSLISQSSEAYYNRAQIYIGIAESCADFEQLSMSDRAVYEMAWEDLNQSVGKGNRGAKKQADFLNKNYITQNKDWFLNVDEGKNKFRPTDDCYSMINRFIIKRSF
ncbi:MAG: hypothetical protein CMG00_04590 [Candidatus Marinimicrobia bacterium]|nr:hypothetical protein [Candidatus Neomarinimicrobiota bacterium]|tara:strand:- start:3337 stop:4716 length:1380 start_codon:yes stop_codon:yes gene_type:complete